MTEIFLGREALRDGLSRHDLRRWYRPVFRGVYAPKYAQLTLHDRIYAAWLSTDRTGIIAGAAASALHGSMWVDDTEPIEVLVGNRRRQPGLVVRADQISPGEYREVGELLVTTPERTAFDLGRRQSRSEAIIRLDSLARAAPFSTATVTTLIQRHGPARGVRQLRELLPLVDAGAQSPKESWWRLYLIDNGFPAPQTQIPVVDGGLPLAFLDMGWHRTKLAVEYDGDQHRTERSQYVKDLRRLPMLAQQGWEVIRVVAEDHPREVLGRIYDAHLRRGGAEIGKMAWATRTFAAKGAFGRSGGRAA